MVCYPTFMEYIECSTDDTERIARIKAIIRALEDSMLAGALKANIEEYKFDDGQTRIETVFRDVNSINNAIKGLERSLKSIQNRVVGHRYRVRRLNIGEC